jgi:hypothetical protein
MAEVKANHPEDDTPPHPGESQPKVIRLGNGIKELTK